MAIAVLYELSGMAQEQYDKIIELLQRGGITAEGRTYHLAGPTETGWRVLDVFESQSAFDAFVQNKLGPMMQEAQVSPPQIQIWPAYNVLTGINHHL